MGGSAFPGYTIPRMNHAQYNELQEKCIALLREKRFYRQVISPPEGPSKADHGDVDLLACDPLHDFNADDLMAALGACAFTKALGGTTSFCLPLPGSEAEEFYAQVDIHVTPADFFAWELFCKSYGDMLQIIGRLERPLGLTATDRGLHVRLEGLEARNRKAAMVYLTDDRDAMLRFLGLSTEAFARGFKSDEQLFEWVAQGRFFGEALLQRDGNDTANDRARLGKRPMFTAFMLEWAPAHRELFAAPKTWSREEVLEEALSFFGDVPRAECERKLAENAILDREDALMAAIKAAVPVEEARRGLVVKGLHRFVTLQDGELVMLDPDHPTVGDGPKWTREVPEKDFDAVVQFAVQNCENLMRLEKRRANAMKKSKGKSAKPAEEERDAQE